MVAVWYVTERSGQWRVVRDGDWRRRSGERVAGVVLADGFVLVGQDNQYATSALLLVLATLRANSQLPEGFPTTLRLAR